MNSLQNAIANHNKKKRKSLPIQVWHLDQHNVSPKLPQFVSFKPSQTISLKPPQPIYPKLPLHKRNSQNTTNTLKQNRRSHDGKDYLPTIKSNHRIPQNQKGLNIQIYSKQQTNQQTNRLQKEQTNQSEKTLRLLKIKIRCFGIIF